MEKIPRQLEIKEEQWIFPAAVCPHSITVGKLGGASLTAAVASPGLSCRGAMKW